MRLSIVILNWNTKEYLRKFLPGLLESVQGYDAGVTVADNGSTDGSVRMLEEEFPTVHVIPFNENLGFTGGYNRAFDIVYRDFSPEYFLLLNSDIEVAPGWLQPLLEHMDSHPRCGACSPKLLSWYDRGSFEYAGAAGGFLDKFGYTFCRGRLMKEVERDNGQYDAVKDVFWATGAFLMVRSSVFKELGGLDARYFAHFEEIDLCWRMHLKGYHVSVVPQSVAYHLGGGTLPNDSPLKLKLNYRNTLLTLENNLADTYAPEEGPAKAARHARRTICLRMVLDGLSAAAYLLGGKPAFFRSVLEAHGEFRRMRKGPAVHDGTVSMDIPLYPRWIIPMALLRRQKLIETIHNL